MNKKDIQQLRRRMSTDKNNIGKIYGCYINDKKEVISYIDESTAMMSELEADKYFALLKKALSGTHGRNLMEIEFSTSQVTDSERHELLCRLRESGSGDKELREKLFSSVIDALTVDDNNYLILLAFDKYDVPNHDANGEEDGESDTVFTYFICCVCPVKDGRAELGYSSPDGKFRTKPSNQIVCPPTLGFMFPAFEDRCANIYKTLYYTKDTETLDGGLIEALFGTDIPMSAGEQKQTFASVLGDTLQNECSLEVIQTVHEQLRERIEEHKASKDNEELDISVAEVGSILKEGGVDDEKAEKFCTECTERFGKNASLKPENIIDGNKFILTTPQVKITVDPEYSGIVETRVIDGIKYITIPASEGVEVNGVSIKIK